MEARGGVSQRKSAFVSPTSQSQQTLFKSQNSKDQFNSRKSMNLTLQVDKPNKKQAATKQVKINRASLTYKQQQPRVSRFKEESEKITQEELETRISNNLSQSQIFHQTWQEKYNSLNSDYTQIQQKFQVLRSQFEKNLQEVSRLFNIDYEQATATKSLKK